MRKIRVALGSNDGENIIPDHMGTAKDFYIFDLFEFQEEFDRASISFTLHGFEDEDKEKVIADAHRALKPGGAFWILDYDEFDLDSQWFPFRWAFRRFECELASEFLSLDLKG